MIHDQPITNFPSGIWFQEIASEDFNEPVSVAVPTAPSGATVAEVRLAPLDRHRPERDEGDENEGPVTFWTARVPSPPIPHTNFLRRQAGD
jgi:hypothetical protein